MKKLVHWFLFCFGPSLMRWRLQTSQLQRHHSVPDSAYRMMALEPASDYIVEELNSTEGQDKTKWVLLRVGHFIQSVFYLLVDYNKLSEFWRNSGMICKHQILSIKYRIVCICIHHCGPQFSTNRNPFCINIGSCYLADVHWCKKYTLLHSRLFFDFPGTYMYM